MRYNALVSAANFGILSAIYEQGIVPASHRTIAGATSVDGAAGGQVHLNRIFTFDGIERSLLDPSRGSFPVVIEEGHHTGEWRPAQAASERLGQDVIAQLVCERMASIPSAALRFGRSAPETFLRSQVILDQIASDDLFLRELSERCHNTALFALDLEPRGYENGDMEVIREEAIGLAAIQEIFMSERLRGLLPTSLAHPSPVTFVASIESTVPQRSRLGFTEARISVPNYGVPLTDYFQSRGPFFTHITRL